MGGQRVLIVGETGYGKTTLLLRLLHDWSCQDLAQLNYLAHYKLVHFLSCRDFNGQWRSLFGPVKEEAELGQSLATELESQTLFLLDGLDELSGWPEELADLLEGTLMIRDTWTVVSSFFVFLMQVACIRPAPFWPLLDPCRRPSHTRPSTDGSSFTA